MQTKVNCIILLFIFKLNLFFLSQSNNTNNVLTMQQERNDTIFLEMCSLHYRPNNSVEKML